MQAEVRSQKIRRQETDSYAGKNTGVDLIASRHPCPILRLPTPGS
jgi:hypothetical protein